MKDITKQEDKPQATILNTALDHVKKGRSVIFLSDPNGNTKYPGKDTILEWTPYQTKIALEAEIKEWFSDTHSNLGLVTGKISGYTVVDIDTKKGADFTPFKDIKTLRVKTGGGYHLYFKYTPRITGSWVSRVAPNVDLRNDRAYVVAPPSIHQNGHQYYIDQDLPSIEMPEWIIQLAEKSKPTVERVNLDTQIFKEGEKPSRHDGLVSKIGKLIYKVPPELWDELVLPRVKEWNKTHCIPAIEESEVERQFKSLCDKEHQKTKTDEAVILPPSKSAKELNELEEIKIDWIWNGYLTKGHATMMSALWKSGKSTLIGHLINAIRSENCFLNKEVRKCNILVITEESEAIVKIRNSDVGINKDDGVRFINHPPRMNPKNWKSALEQVRKECENYNIELVIIDTLSKFWPVEDSNSDTNIEKMYAEIQEELLSHDLAVFLIHHVRKSGEGRDGAGTQHRGSGALAAAVDILMTFERVQGADVTRRVLNAQSRFGSETPDNIILDWSEAGGYTVLGDKPAVRKEDKYRIILETFNTQEEMTAEEIKEKWPWEHVAPDITTVRRQLNEMEEKGLVIKAMKDGGTKPFQVWRKRKSIVIVPKEEKKKLFLNYPTPPWKDSN